MIKWLTKRGRFWIIIGFVLMLSLLNIVMHEFSVSKQTKPFIRLQSSLRRRPMSRPPTASPWSMNNNRFGQQYTKKNQTFQGIKNFTATLILTYMRSGSSVTGEIMQQHPDTFYVFEPLHMLETSFRANFPIQFMNGTYIRQGSYSWEEIAIPTLQAWFNCDLQNVFQRGLLDKLFLSFGKKTAFLHRCIEHENPQNSYDIYTSTIKFCVQKLQHLCLASKHRVIKTIRTNMQQIKAITATVPQLKVIHLIRDPRDTMMSQKVVGACGNASLEELSNCTSFYCTRLNSDILAKEEMLELKDQVLTVYFERLALHPLKISDEIYKFSGMELTETVRNSISDLTTYKSRDKCAVCQLPWQQLGNVTMTGQALISKWSKKMPEVFRVLVDVLCKESISYLNYSVNPYLSAE